MMKKWTSLGLVALMMAGAACNKKSKGNGGGGSVPSEDPGSNPPPQTQYTSYLGDWRFLHNLTSGDGTCDTIAGEHEVGTATVDDTGRFQVSARGVAGRIDLGSGQVTINVSETQPCGRGTGSGSMSSYTEGSGTYDQNGEAPHSYTWRLVR